MPRKLISFGQLRTPHAKARKTAHTEYYRTSFIQDTQIIRYRRKPRRKNARRNTNLAPSPFNNVLAAFLTSDSCLLHFAQFVMDVVP